MDQKARNQQKIIGNYNAQAGPHGKASVEVHNHWHQVTSPNITPQDLEHAEAQFDFLPIDRVPDPAHLPSGSHMPWPAHQDFVGREADLKRLATLFKAEKTTAIGQIAAATGMGGIGKTQLASAFAHRYGQYFAGGVQWISLADPDAVSAEIIIAGITMFPDSGFTQKPLEEQIALVLGVWKSPLPRLLVFDNCEDEELLKAWRPPSGGAKILITSRKQQWSRALGIKPHSLSVFSRRESLTLLLKHRPDLESDDPDLNEIADRLGDLPLALHLAGSYLERYRFEEFGQPAAYLDELGKPYFLEHHSLIEGQASPTDHEQHIGRTFALSYERLNPRDDGDGRALDLLARASCFAPGRTILRKLLLATLSNKDRKTEIWWRKSVIGFWNRIFDKKTGSDSKSFSDALERLIALGLLQQEDNGHLVLHRLLALFVHHRTADLSSSQAAVEEVVRARASKINDSGLPGPLLAWQGHLRHVAEMAVERKSDNAGWLLFELGYHLWRTADYADAKSYYERALEIFELVRGPDHPDVAVGLNNLGLVLKDQGDLEGAKTRYERALAIDEKVLGPDHPEVAIHLNNLGLVFQAQGDLEGAKTNLKRALAIDKKTLGSNHPNVARGLNNLGDVLREQGDLEGAKTNYERALAINQKAFGPSHPAIASILNNLGEALRAQGDFAGAKINYERALAIDEKALGPDHPNIAIGLNNLGLVFQAQGDLEGAKTNYERAHAIMLAIFGPDHHYTKDLVGKMASLKQQN